MEARKKWDSVVQQENRVTWIPEQRQKANQDSTNQRKSYDVIKHINIQQSGFDAEEKKNNPKIKKYLTHSQMFIYFLRSLRSGKKLRAGA